MSAIERFGCAEILRKEKATLDAELEIKTKSVTDPSGNREFVLDNLKWFVWKGQICVNTGPLKSGKVMDTTLLENAIFYKLNQIMKK